MPLPFCTAVRFVGLPSGMVVASCCCLCAISSVAVGVGVDVAVGVAVGVAVDVGLAVAVGVGVSVAAATCLLWLCYQFGCCRRGRKRISFVSANVAGIANGPCRSRLIGSRAVIAISGINCHAASEQWIICGEPVNAPSLIGPSPLL